MEPGIGRSLRQGFRAANQSWGGIGFFAGVWILLLILVILGFVFTKPPKELFQEPRVEEPAAPEEAPVPKDVVAPLSEATSPQTPTTETQKVDLFRDLAATEATATPAQPAVAPAQTTPAPEQGVGPSAAERNRIVGEWLGHVWPLLLVYFIVFIVAGTWLYGGQIGYLAKRVTSGEARVLEFWVSGNRAFRALLGGSLLAWLAFAGVFVLVVLISLLFGWLSKALPTWTVVVLALILGVAAVVGLVWLAIRLSLWFIAIVVDRLGALTGLKAAFRATRGYWWKLAALGALVVVISYAVWLPFVLLEWVGNLIGGMAALVGIILGNALGAIANLYVGFVTIAAFIRFYEDAKSAPPARASPPVP